MTNSNLFYLKFPEGLKDFKKSLNPAIEIKKLTYSARKKINWECHKCSHRWTVSLNSRTQFQVLRECPKCSRKIADQKRRVAASIKTGSIKSVKPEILEEWNYIKNKGFDPTKISHKSSQNFWWICKNCGSEFKTRPHARIVEGTGCRKCSFEEMGHRYQKIAAKKNWFGKSNPELIQMWDSKKNKDLNIEEYSKSSNIKVYWKCKFNHSFLRSFNDMTSKGSNCPECNLTGTSKNELRIYLELKKILSKIVWRNKINNVELDLFITDYKIGIEYDGVHWHKNKYDFDLNKNNQFKKLDIKIIRVREKGLEKIGRNDLVVDLKPIEKKDINNLIFNIYKITKSPIIYKAYKNYLNTNKFLAQKEYLNVISRLPAPPSGHSFAEICKDKVKFWDFNKNFPLMPEMFWPRATYKAFWKCDECGASFKKSLDRVFVNKYVCNYCAVDQAVKFRKQEKKKLIEVKPNIKKFINEETLKKINTLAPKSHIKIKLKCPSCSQIKINTSKQVYANKYLCYACGIE